MHMTDEKPCKRENAHLNQMVKPERNEENRAEHTPHENQLSLFDDSNEGHTPHKDQLSLF